MPMTERVRLLAAIRGDIPDRLPWVPRLEFWYRARLRSGTLPSEFRSLSLPEIADRLGVGYYASVPDFTACPTEVPNPDHTIGIYNALALPYEVEYDNVDRRIARNGNETVIEYRTPVGAIRTSLVFTEEMLDAGVSQPWIAQHAISNPQDFAVVGYIFSHLRVKPRLQHYLALRDQIGERGLAVAFASGSAGPVHFIMKHLMREEQFFYAMADYPEKIQELSEKIEPFFRSILEIAASTPAEVVLLGGNYDDSITHPAFFRQHILPALREYGKTLHQKGKHLMTHTDGENRRLLSLYRDAGFDIADSVCPSPMTRCTVDELLQAFEGHITMWGGIPSILLCPASSTEEQFRRFIDELLARHGRRSRLILGISDMVTADAEWDRLNYITERVRASG
jgi:uroporphyrinogen-III decarboxylase